MSVIRAGERDAIAGKAQEAVHCKVMKHDAAEVHQHDSSVDLGMQSRLRDFWKELKQHDQSKQLKVQLVKEKHRKTSMWW